MSAVASSRTPMVAKPTLVIKRVKALTDAEFKDCDRLNYGCNQWSVMQEELRWQRQIAGKRSQAYLIKEADDAEVLAWALVCYPRGEKYKKAFFYVPPKYRRQGLGKMLGDAVAKNHPSAEVAPWNQASKGFFANYQFPCDPNYEHEA